MLATIFSNRVMMGAVRHGRHGHELQVGEARLEHEVQLDRRVDGVGGEEHVIEQVPGREHHPLVGVKRLVGPVEVAVVGQQVVADQQRDLGVPDLIQRPQGGHRPPGAVAPEPGHPLLAHGGRVFRQGKRTVVELDQLNPPWVEVVEEVGLAERRAYTEHGGVLLPLIRDILTVSRAVDLVPVAPRLVRQPGTAADLLREELPLLDVAGCPVDLAREV